MNERISLEEFAAVYSQARTCDINTPSEVLYSKLNPLKDTPFDHAQEMSSATICMSPHGTRNVGIRMRRPHAEDLIGAWLFGVSDPEGEVEKTVVMMREAARLQLTTLVTYNNGNLRATPIREAVVRTFARLPDEEAKGTFELLASCVRQLVTSPDLPPKPAL